MKFLRYLILLLLSFPASAQETYILPGQSVELATYVPTSTAIKGMQYTFPANVHSYYHDAANNELIVLLKKDKELKIGAVGELLVFDMNKNTVKWRANINTFKVFITGKYVISSEKGNTHCYFRSNGKQAWSKMDASVKYIDERKGLVLTDYIRALDINTGKIVWQKYLPVRYNWEDVRVMDDSSIIVATGGLYRINLYTGKGWNTNEITGKDEFDIPNAIGIIPEWQTEKGVTVPQLDNKANVWKSTTSGILVDQHMLFFATNKRLLALNKLTGAYYWDAALPKETGISSLFVVNDHIVIANEAKVANQQGVAKKYGKPYMAIFNKMEGRQEVLHTIAPEGAVLKTEVLDNVVNILSEQYLYRYDVMNDKELELQKFDAREVAPHMVSADISLYYNGENTVYENDKAIVKTPAANKGFISKQQLYIVDNNTLSVIPLKQPE